MTMETNADLIRATELIARRATDAFLVVSADRMIESANPQASLLFATDTGALRGTPLSRWVPELIAALDRPLAAWETEALSHASDRIPVELAIIPIDDGSGRAWVVLRDITRRRGLEGSIRHHAEELERIVTARLRALDDLHRKYRTLYDQAPILDFEIDSEDAISSANRKAFLSVGVAVEKLIGVPIADLVTPSRRESFRDAIAKVRRGSTEPIETNLRGNGGSTLDIIFHVVQDDGHRPGSLRLMGLDVTAHRESERLVDQGLELAEAQRARMERILRGVAQGIAVMDVDGQIRLLNETGEKLLGMEEKWAFGRDLFKEHEDARFSEEWCDFIEGAEEMLSTEIRSGGSSGSRISCSVSRIRTPEGRPAGFVALLQDRTQESRAQESSSDRWRRTIDELRVPITAIRSVAPSLVRAEGLSRETQTLASLLEKETERLAGALEDIQLHSRLETGREGLNLRRVSFARLVTDALAAESAAAGGRAIRFEISGIDQECPAQLDVETMRIVLQGILQFAVQLTFDGRAIEVKIGQDDRRYACTIRASGRAISPQETDVVRKGLEPRLGAAPAERGLSLARRILQLHQGEIELENRTGGAWIRISIPREESFGSRTDVFTSAASSESVFAAGPIEDAGDAEIRLDSPPDEAVMPLATWPPAVR
jgi:PAS domain S-box-containing protein